MRYLKSALLAAACFLSTTVFSAASTLNSRIEQIAEKFTASAGSIGLSTATIAVFPFEADDRLSKKKVNFAVSELLTKHILMQQALRITERAQLSEVLKEQRLGLSGAIDSKTAASFGEVLGARLLVLGNVVKLGEYYQITAKLVDAKTAELVTSEIIEVPIETFDKDAAPYLVLVPEKQAIGVFLAGYYSAPNTKNSGAVTYSSTRFIPNNPEAHSASAGGGVRYWPTNNYMIEGSYFPFNLKGGQAYSTPDTPSNNAGIPNIRLSGEIFRLLVSRTFRISKEIHLHLGTGALYINARNSSSYTAPHYYHGPGLFLIVSQSETKLKYLTPILRTGIEWKPQERFGWGVFGSYNLIKKSLVQNAVLANGTASPQTVRVWKAELSPFALETTLSLYF